MRMRKVLDEASFFFNTYKIHRSVIVTKMASDGPCRLLDYYDAWDAAELEQKKQAANEDATVLDELVREASKQGLLSNPLDGSDTEPEDDADAELRWYLQRNVKEIPMCQEEGPKAPAIKKARLPRPIEVSVKKEEAPKPGSRSSSGFCQQNQEQCKPAQQNQEQCKPAASMQDYVQQAEKILLQSVEQDLKQALSSSQHGQHWQHLQAPQQPQKQQPVHQVIQQARGVEQLGQPFLHQQPVPQPPGAPQVHQVLHPAQVAQQQGQPFFQQHPVPQTQAAPQVHQILHPAQVMQQPGQQFLHLQQGHQVHSMQQVQQVWHVQQGHQVYQHTQAVQQPSQPFLQQQQMHQATHGAVQQVPQVHEVFRQAEVVQQHGQPRQQFHQVQPAQMHTAEQDDWAAMGFSSRREYERVVRHKFKKPSHKYRW